MKLKYKTKVVYTIELNGEEISDLLTALRQYRTYAPPPRVHVMYHKLEKLVEAANTPDEGCGRR